MAKILNTNSTDHIMIRCIFRNEMPVFLYRPNLEQVLKVSVIADLALGSLELYVSLGIWNELPSLEYFRVRGVVSRKTICNSSKIGFFVLLALAPLAGFLSTHTFIFIKEDLL